MKDFESPLQGNSSFLVFIKVTLGLLKTWSDYYNHVVKDLVESWKWHVQKSFNERRNMTVGTLPQDKTAMLLSWLHESLIIEIEILHCAQLEKSKIKFCTGQIFNSFFSKTFRSELESFKIDEI